MKRTVPLLIAGITGFGLILSHFIPDTQTWGEVAMKWFQILAAFAFVLGGGNLLKMHLEKISYQRAGWGYSVVTVTAFVLTLFVGLGKLGVDPNPDYPDHPWSGSYLQEGSVFSWLYDYVFYPLSATMFALLAFFIASAAFRAFRAKNTEASILLVTAFIVLLGRTYVGEFLTSWLPDPLSGLKLPELTETIMNIFNLAGTRAIMIGIALGIVSTSLKVLLGVDRSYLGSDQE